MYNPRRTSARRALAIEKGLDKGRVAEAVHRAVCRMTGGDGSRGCQRYAHAGHGLLDYLGIDTAIRAGTLRIVLDTETGEEASLPYFGTFGLDITSGHVWLERRGSPIDFASRHYPSYTDRAYPRVPPRYVWGRSGEWARFEGDDHASAELGEMACESIDLMAEAVNQYEGREVVRPVNLGSLPDGRIVAVLAKVDRIVAATGFGDVLPISAGMASIQTQIIAA